MNIRISKGSLIRISSYSIALVLVMGGAVWQSRAAAADYRLQLENAYARSLGEISSYLTNIANDLDKGKYVGTPNQLVQVSARIWRESGSAKSALSTLPVSELHMDNTYKFLSQVGDYAMTLSRKVAHGGTLTEDERKSAEALRQYAGKLCDYVDDIHAKIRDGQIDVAAVRTGGVRYGDDTEGTKATGISAGFEDIEQTMTGYPTLIYDGPFSDHLLTQQPKLTRGMAPVTPEEARWKAAVAARVAAADLRQYDDENSNMPSYTFQAGQISIGVTKTGGLVTYMINARDIGEERLNRDAVFQRAAQYLADLGIADMRATYYETADGICTINYAAMSGSTTLYTDLIKVGVALDDGSIVFYDARGYINNHRERALGAPVLPVEQAAASVSPYLTVEQSRVALIPTDGGGEVLTYEFRTRSEDDQNLLVYVNANTGAEEKILILIETPNGTLTK